jgi:predicted ArsR family transcriptional regulator
MDDSGSLSGVRAPGLGTSQRALLEALKRTGPATVARLAGACGLNVETVRDHLKLLIGHGLLRRERAAPRGRGRPEIVYALTSGAELLFPRREGEVLGELASYLRSTGQESVLRAFFDRYIGDRREAALARVSGLEGRARLDEAARILTELGFMAVVEESDAGPRLRLCHCPIRDLIEVTRVPCGAEIGFVTELVGERLTRMAYIPAGDACCSYGRTGTRRARAATGVSA